MLELLKFRSGAVAAGALAIAAGPYTAFAGSRPLADPLAALLWWIGIVSILDWTIERVQDALLTEELDPGLFRRQGEIGERKEARIHQFLDILSRAIGAHLPVAGALNRTEQRQ